MMMYTITMLNSSLCTLDYVYPLSKHLGVRLLFLLFSFFPLDLYILQCLQNTCVSWDTLQRLL